MKNYINIDGKKIPLSEETVNNFKKELEVKNEPKTYQELMKNLGKRSLFFIDKYGKIDTYISPRLLEHSDEALSKEQLESILALNKLANVAYVLNDGWVPDWEDEKEKKFNIYINYGSLEIEFWHKIDRGSVKFKTRKLAQKAIGILGEKEIRKALTLNHK